MDCLRIYFDLVSNLFLFLTMELFAEFHLKTFDAATKKRLRLYYISFVVIYAFPSNLPHLFTYIDLCIDFIYFYLVGKKATKYCFVTFLKYKIYIAVFSGLLYLSHTYLLNDFYYLDVNKTYDNAKSAICDILLYIILFLYIYSKRLSVLHDKRHYGIYFSAATFFSCYLLSYFSLLLAGKPTENSRMLPVIFSLFLIIIVVCLTSYQQIVLTLKKNADQALVISRYETEHAYYQDVDKSLKTISSLRHDFKNHLLILDSYAKKQDMENLLQFISKLNTELNDTKLIQSQSSLVSAILNAKAGICQEKNIEFTADCQFPSVSISDFHLITILGNLLDNSITAAAKVPEGYVHITLHQVDSYLEIICKNNHMEKIRRKKEQFLTTKEGNHMFHGIGIKNIQSSVTSLNGTLDINYSDSAFTVNILVPNYA